MILPLVFLMCLGITNKFILFVWLDKIKAQYEVFYFYFWMNDECWFFLMAYILFFSYVIGI